MTGVIAARLQYGPYDGLTGQVPTMPLPLALDVRPCHGCGCGRPTHYRVAEVEDPPAPGFARYELVDVTDIGGALYRHADTLDPLTERTLAEVLNR